MQKLEFSLYQFLEINVNPCFIRMNNRVMISVEIDSSKLLLIANVLTIFPFLLFYSCFSSNAPGTQ